MGKKYIIEIGRLERLYKAFISAHGKPEITWLSPEVDLTPYTEPDTEAAYAHGYSNAELKYRAEVKEAYQKGLSDAWEAARKVTQVRKYGGYGDCLEEVFGRHRVPWDVFDYSATEAIEKLRQYEQEKEEQKQLQVGDEVINRNKTAVVTEITDRYVRIMYSDGSGYALFSEGVVKTGRHFPEIAAVLEKMRENNG